MFTLDMHKNADPASGQKSHTSIEFSHLNLYWSSWIFHQLSLLAISLCAARKVHCVRPMSNCRRRSITHFPLSVLKFIDLTTFSVYLNYLSIFYSHVCLCLSLFRSEIWYCSWIRLPWFCRYFIFVFYSPSFFAWAQKQRYLYMYCTSRPK